METAAVPAGMTEIVGGLGGPGAIVLALLLLVAGWVIGRVAGVAISAAVGDPLGTHRTLILRRSVSWGLFALFAVSALHQLGIQLSVLLGAAGILTVAVGFAAQTAASNLVSGIFLLGERPFEIGETIRIGTTSGEVISVDLLSIKLRTFDNLLVRIPNETVMKSEVTNFTRFPIRRHDLRLFIDPVADLEDLERVLLEAARSPLVLVEPKPIVIFLGYTDSGLEVQLSAWALRAHFLEMRNGLHRDVMIELRRAGIAIGYPNRILEARRPASSSSTPPSGESSNDSSGESSDERGPG